ncbi:MAG: TolC family outer membrane protein [Leptothrix sp. (in: b-proteobacteria)]
MTLPIARRPVAQTLLMALLMPLAFTAVPTRAQSLRELFDAARAYDSSLMSAQAQADATRYRADQADALLRPNVGLVAGVAQTVTDTPLAGTRALSAGTAGVSAVQPLINRANRLAVDKARRTLDLAQADLQTAEQDLIVRTAQAYFDVLGAIDALGFARTSKQAISEQLASAQANFKAGNATIVDTREAQARFDLATAQEIAADNDLTTKRIALDQLVGKTGSEPKPLAQPVALPNLPADDVEAWVSKTTAAPLVLKARVGYEIAQLETRRSDAGHVPTLDLEGSAGSAYNRGSAATSSGGKGLANNAKVGVTLRWPLYTGGLIENQVKEAASLEEKARHDLDTTTRLVAQATRQGYFGVQSGQAQVTALQAAEASSKVALEATLTGYRVGVRVNLDVLNAQTQLYSTQRDLAKARYDVLVNGIRLRQAAGVLGVDDVDAVDRLLAR